MALQQTKDCEFCDELSGGTDNSFRVLFDADEVPSRALLDTGAFVATPGLGALLPGYVLIWTRAHIASIGHLSASALDELESLLISLRSRIHTEVGVGTVLFEHGNSSRNLGIGCGACIDHAHIHICPTHRDLISADNTNFPTPRPIEKLSDLHYWIERKLPYLFYEDLCGSRFVFTPDRSLPSQFMRTLWASSLNVPDQWDWALYPIPENIIATLKMFDVPCHVI